MDTAAAIAANWPGDTEFVVLRKADWEIVKSLAGAAVQLDDRLEGMTLLPLELELPEDDDFEPDFSYEEDSYAGYER